jgi:peptidoglycan/LPS O-acetylase OafA/YrhL
MRRIAELDGLRGIAAIAIVAFHYSYPGILYDKFLYIGHISLDLFFVLSGFLISSIILCHVEQKGFLRAFYFRRGLRIYPIYYLIVGAYTVLVALRPDMGDLRAAPYYWTFTQNIQHYWFTDAPLLSYALSPTWSLAVEEQFYIAWPLLIGCLGRRWMVPAALASIALAIGARFVGFGSQILITNCDGFAFGGLLAVALAGRPTGLDGSRRLAGVFAVVGVATLLYLVFGLRLGGGGAFEPEGRVAVALYKSIVACFFACVIGLAVCHEGHPVLAPLRARWLGYIGTISYGVYLYHLTAIVIASIFVTKLHLRPELLGLVFAPALCLAISAASWAWIEKPCLRLKDRFKYGASRTKTPIEPAASPRTAPVPERELDPDPVS